MGEKYAVLISGDQAESGYDEFWNDVVLMREALIQNGFLADHIYILYGKGTDFSSAKRSNPLYRPHPAITNFPADLTNVEMVFTSMAQGKNNMPQLTNKDILFIWTFDHGFADKKNSYLCLIDGDLMDENFAKLVNKIPYAYRIICMQQCFSGGFIPHLSNNKTVILTACSDQETANRSDNENETVNRIIYNHGEFNYHLLSAITGKTVNNVYVNADTNSDGFVSMKEAFNYIKTSDSQNETPQYNSKRMGVGEKVHLDI